MLNAGLDIGGIKEIKFDPVLLQTCLKQKHIE